MKFVTVSFTNKRHSFNLTTFFITTLSKILHSCIISMSLRKFTIDLLRPRSIQFSLLYLRPCQPHTTPALTIAHARAVSQLSIKLPPCRTLISNMYTRHIDTHTFSWYYTFLGFGVFKFTMRVSGPTNRQIWTRKCWDLADFLQTIALTLEPPRRE